MTEIASPANDDPSKVYHQRSAAFGGSLASLERSARRTGNFNLVLFGSSVLALTVTSVRSDAAWYWLSGVLAVAFVAGIIFFQRLKRNVGRLAALTAINREGLLRLGRDWKQLPPPPSEVHVALPVQGIDAATAADLDLFGPASLEHLLNTATTPIGQATLRAWILERASPLTVLARQEAVRELASQIDFRDEVGAQGRQMGKAQAHYERFVSWAESDPWLLHQPIFLWAARLLPPITLVLAVAAWYAGEQSSWLYLALGAVLLISLILSLTVGSRAGETIGQVEAQQGVFGAYAALFDLLSNHAFVAPELRRLQEQLRSGDKDAASAGEQMRRLQRLMPLAGIRRWILFFPIEVVTLWNFHLLWLLERWQIRTGNYVRHWLEALGQFEALVALATLHHDHPAWVFPELQADVEQNQVQVSGIHLAHPLLPPDKAKGNDVQVGPPGSFLLVTGSNMSGKSTLLRAIGVNCVLAQMGGPVCAQRLVLPPLQIASSMRVQDSLAQGVSFFMAELHGLKAVVDLADASAKGRGAPLLYLLDEILQGTNTAERQIAARHVIRRLVDARAIGAVSTHDLTLAAAPDLATSAVPVHFTESFQRGPEGATMQFDYKLRPGVATSTNALKLMEIVGLAAASEVIPEVIDDTDAVLGGN